MKRSPLRRRAKSPNHDRVRLAPEPYRAWKAKLAERAGWRCENPTCRTARGPFDVDHLIRRSAGGADGDSDHAVYVCRACHERRDWPYDRGRLVVTALGEERFTFEVVTKADKWAGRDARGGA